MIYEDESLAHLERFDLIKKAISMSFNDPALSEVETSLERPSSRIHKANSAKTSRPDF
jgi:hypothetical protein